jgi:hypothetical protein
VLAIGYYTKVEDAIRSARSEAKHIYKEGSNPNQAHEPDENCKAKIFATIVWLNEDCSGLEYVAITVVEGILQSYESEEEDEELEYDEVSEERSKIKKITPPVT